MSVTLIKSDNGIITTEMFATVKEAYDILEDEFNEALASGKYLTPKTGKTPQGGSVKLISKDYKNTIGWKIEMNTATDENIAEDKVSICNALCSVLQKTRCCSDLIGIDYDEEKEEVILKFVSGIRKVNVEADSGIAMIRDVVKNV